MGSSGNPFGMTNIAAQPQYVNDPSRYQSFDAAGLSNAQIAGSNQQGSNKIAQDNAQMAGMGAGRSSAAQNAQQGVLGHMAQNAQNIYNKNAGLSYAQRLAQMQNQNQFNLANQANQNAVYGTNANAINNANGINIGQNQMLMDTMQSYLNSSANSNNQNGGY